MNVVLMPTTQMATHLQGLHDHRERIYMVVAELFFNALDHGLLLLGSALKETPQGFGEYYSQRTKRLADLEDGTIELRLIHELRDTGGVFESSSRTAARASTSSRRCETSRPTRGTVDEVWP